MRKRKGRNRRRKPKLYRRSSLILLLTIIYSGIFVAPIFIQQFKEVHVAKDVLLGQASLDAITTFVQIFCLLFGLTVLRIVWVILWPLLTIFTAISNYMVTTFHAQVSKDSVAVVVESTSREMSNFLNLDLIISLLSALTLGILGVLLIRREKKETHNFRVAAIIMLLTIGVITINDGSMSTRFPPYNFLTAATQYALERTSFLSTTRKNISEFPSQIHTVGNMPLTVVLVLGESARGDHFSINGYEKETTPFIQQRKNLVNFKNTSSCGVWTRISVPCILTRATEGDKSAIYSETSLISLFRSLGFKTFWLGTQNAIDHPLIDIIHEADTFNLLENKQFLDNTVKDEELLPLMDKALEDQSSPTLIILHTFGSHWQYSSRYPEAFEKFKPTCAMTLSRHYDTATQISEIKDCSSNNEALVNSYDNSILYTDYILDQVMHRLEGKNALMMYTSDHGESLGEGGRFLHGYETAPENHIVPMFWWASDDFIKNNPARWQSLTKKNIDPSSHDVIFHSVLDCAGISSPVIDPSLSLCRDAPPASQEATASPFPMPVIESPASEPANTTAPSTAPAAVLDEKMKEPVSKPEAATDTGNSEDQATDDEDGPDANSKRTEPAKEPVETKEPQVHNESEPYLKTRFFSARHRTNSAYAFDEGLLLQLTK